jgi:glutamate formiminotransferase
MIECVPNFSEGRRTEVLDKIISAITSVKGVTLLDREMDKSHNRSVVTFVGDADAVKEAAFFAAKKAMELIDLNKHEGEHPRMGATDVIPFIPLEGNTMADCVKLAKELGKEIADKLQIPIYLYEEAATVPERRSLAYIRQGEFEGIREEIGKKPERKPDFGPEKIHPTAGATVVGARVFLIAYNINLNTPDVKIAKQIAKTIRESSGGLPAVRALGVFLSDKNQAQVTMNLVNYKKTGLKTVFEAVKKEAGKLGTSVKESELIGLLPADALAGFSPKELLMDNFKDELIIENKLKLLGIKNV